MSLSPPLAVPLLAAGLSIAAPAVAAASPPVCFPERTVMWSAHLADEHGNVFGGVRAGQVVHVLDERPGPDGGEALIEVREPVRVRGFVARKPLLVFARHDIEIEKQHWYLAEAPLWLFSEAVDGVSGIKLAHTHAAFSHPEGQASCAALRGTPPARMTEDSCHGAEGSTPTRLSGRPVTISEPFVLERDTGPMKVDPEYWAAPFGLLEQRGDRVLLEVFSSAYWQRWQGWATVPAFSFPDGNEGGWTVSHGCCEGDLSIDHDSDAPDYSSPLRTDAPFRPRLGDPVLGTLPRGATVRQLSRYEDETLVRYASSGQGLPWETQLLLVWIPAATLERDPGLPRAVRGRLSFPAGTGCPSVSDVLLATTTFYWGRLEGRAGDDCTFRVPAVLGERHTFHAETRDHRWTSAVIPASAADLGRVPMTERRQHLMYVMTRDGLAVPKAQLIVDDSSLERATTADNGIAARWFDRDGAERELRVRAPRFREGRRRLADISEPILRLSRVAVVSGYVGRDAAGRCRERTLAADGAQVPVRDDCSFSLEWDADASISLRGEDDDSRSVELSPLFGKSASADCRRGPAERREGLRCHVSGDVLDVCLNGPCSNASGRAHLYARVLASSRALAADARVAAFGADGRMLDSCHAPSGACFLHELPAGTPIVLQASARGVTATTSFVTTAGVTERDVLLGAPPVRTGERSADQTPMRSSSIKGAVSGRSRSRSTTH